MAADADWRQKLTAEEYRVLRKKGTEAPGSGKYVNFHEDGMYYCTACGQALFSSDTKYESTMPGLIGWPAFSEAAAMGAVKLEDDTSLGMQRTEVLCTKCGSHLGHVFADDSSPNGQHYCINSVCLNFKAKKITLFLFIKEEGVRVGSGCQSCSDFFNPTSTSTS